MWCRKMTLWLSKKIEERRKVKIAENDFGENDWTKKN